VSAIGSWQPEMIELDPDLLRYAVNTGGSDFHGNNPGGVVIVEDHGHALQAGEIIQSRLRKEQMVELGELLDVRRKENGLRRPQTLGSDMNKRLLGEGLVILKEVMDLDWINELIVGCFCL
jgi:ornithine cyclodeaminase/alanine dehydrogenase-like protein (mu-crystallin family)